MISIQINLSVHKWTSKTTETSTLNFKEEIGIKRHTQLTTV